MLEFINTCGFMQFLIDPDGVIQAVEVFTPSVGRNPDELMRQIQALQHVRETGEPMPSDWTRGEKSLMPRPDPVGKI